ncbi:MAG: Mov34/MPN/PAD-1 family protein [Saprospiraceae bacterium]|nr:Mov34/MPN/PAD-1 family protein [Saprospiraceae bacterium]
MKIRQKAFNKIINHIGYFPAERGGVLFGKEGDFIIEEFIPDKSKNTTRVTYTIDTAYLNPIIKKMWDEKGYSMLGILHSHPHGYQTLSGPDKTYFNDLLSTGIKRDKFYAPVVFTIPDGGFDIFPHLLNNKGEFVKTEEVELLPNKEEITQENTIQKETSIVKTIRRVVGKRSKGNILTKKTQKQKI